MKSYNHVTLLGHLAADPELRETKNGKTFALFPIAIGRNWTDSETGEKHKKVDYHKVIAWRGLAKTCQNYLAKGSAVLLTGRLSNNNYQTDEGEKRYATEVVVQNINILTWKKSKDGDKVAVEDVTEDEMEVEDNE